MRRFLIYSAGVVLLAVAATGIAWFYGTGHFSGPGRTASTGSGEKGALANDEWTIETEKALIALSLDPDASPGIDEAGLLDEYREARPTDYLSELVVHPPVSTDDAPSTSQRDEFTIGISSRTGRSQRLVLLNNYRRADEEAISLGLAWLAEHQNDDGSWSLDAFHKAKCRARCQHAGSVKNDVAATSLALLAFHGAGHTAFQGHYAKVVDRGLRWLPKQQQANGLVRREQSSGGEESHAMATLALCSPFDMTRQRDLRGAAQRAIDHIVSAQQPDGGWRKSAEKDSDVRTTGWHVMALRAGQLADFNVPRETIEKTQSFLGACQTDKSGAIYAPQPGGALSREATAMALLCRQLTGWESDGRAVRDGSSWFMAEHAKDENVDSFLGFVATQAGFRVPGSSWAINDGPWQNGGGFSWRVWQEKYLRPLLKRQTTHGHERGSWPPLCKEDEPYGRLYTTALAICTLEVYFRYLPIYSYDAVKAE